MLEGCSRLRSQYMMREIWYHCRQSPLGGLWSDHSLWVRLLQTEENQEATLLLRHMLSVNTGKPKAYSNSKYKGQKELHHINMVSVSWANLIEDWSTMCWTGCPKKVHTQYQLQWALYIMYICTCMCICTLCITPTAVDIGYVLSLGTLSSTWCFSPQLS